VYEPVENQADRGTVTTFAAPLQAVVHRLGIERSGRPACLG
jgi:hypothetical protein